MEITQRIKNRLSRTADWTAVIDEFEAEAEAIADNPERSVAYAQLARACEDIFLDQARAMQCYQKAFKLDQSNLIALQNAREIYNQMAHLEMVTRLMGLELKANQDPARAPGLNYAYGRAMMNLRQVDTARPFLEAAAAAEPANVEFAQRAIEAQYDRAAWTAALDGIIGQITALTGAEDPLAASVAKQGPELSSLYLRAARILQQEAPDDPRLLPMLFKALDAHPLNDEAGFLAETVLATAGHTQHIQRLQDRRVALIEDVPGKVALLRRFAATWQLRLNNPAMAAYFLRQALELAYEHGVASVTSGSTTDWHLAAFRAVKLAAMESGQVEGLVGMADKALGGVPDPMDRALLAVQAGEIAWRSLSDLDGARRLLAEAAAVSAEHPVVAAFIAEFGGFAPTAAEAEPAAAPEPEPPAEPEAAAATAEPEPEPEPEAAPPAAEPVAAAAPEPEPVAAGPAVELGDESFTADQMKLIEAAQAAMGKGGKAAIDGWRAAVVAMPDKTYPRAQLKAVYAAQGKWSNVADVVKDALKQVPDEDLAARVELHWELVSLYRDQLKQPGLIVTTLGALEKLLEVEGQEPELLRVVEAQQEQFEAMKRWPDLIGRVRRRAELTTDPIQATALHLEAGRLFLDKFNNQAEAIKSFEAVLDADELNGEAIGQLKDLYGKRRDWEKLLWVQQKELGLIADPAERLTQLLDVARTAGTKIKKPALSIQLWTQVLELDPGNAEALENLEGMQEREKDWPALAQTLEQLIDITDAADKQSAYLVKLGVLYSDKLEDNTAAIRAWERLAELDPENRRAQDALKKLYLAAGDMDRLEAFYGRQDKWGEFIRVLEREAETAEGESKLTFALKIADLYRDKAGKPDRAIRTLEKVLADDGSNLVVAEKLIALYEEAGDERNISAPLAIKLEHTDDGVERLALLRRLADLAERVQGDAGLAFSYYKAAFEEDHRADDAREALARLAEVTNLWPSLAQSLEMAIERFGADTGSLPLRLEAAAVYEQRLVDLDKALALNQSVLEIDGEEPTALASLERLYLALGRESDLLAVLATKLSLAANDDDRRAIQTRIGSIHEQLGHADEAVAAYEAVLATGVEDPAVLAALDRIFSSQAKHAELADILRRQLAVTDPADEGARAGLLLRLGLLSQDQLGDHREAVELYRQVLELQADEPTARARLEGWLGDESLRSDVATILLPVYERIEAWPQLVQCLEIQAAVAGSAHERVELLLRAGAILAQAMGDSRAAFEAYSRAFREDPHSETAQAALENIATIDDRWGDFAALYEEAVGKDLPVELLRTLLHKLAALYDTQLGDAAKAIACFQRASDIDPDNREALDALERLYQRGEQWSELLEVFRRKVDLEGDPDERQRLRFQIAYLQEELLARQADAIATYNEILADDEVNLRAITSLDRLYQATEQWAELAENLDRQLTLTGDAAQQIALNLRLGALRLQRLDQHGLAVETYSRVLELDPHEANALAALESLLGAADHQLAVARILEPIYRATSQWPKLIHTYEIMVGASLDPGEKIRLLHQIGELYEIAGDEPSKAFAALGRALKEDPANADTQGRLENLARQLGAYAELVGLYEGVVEDVVDDQLRIVLLGKVAQVYEHALDDAAKAAAAYEKMLGVDPGNFAAVDALIEVHRRTNNFEALVGAVVRKSDMMDDPAGRKQLLLYAANVRETVMESPAGAIELYRQVLTLDDADRTALDALEKLYIQLENWEALKDVYQRKTELAEDPEERRKVLYVLGQVYDAELKDLDRAIDTYQAILDIDAGDPQAIQALDRLYGQAERWLDQLQILERAVETSDRAEEQTAYRYRIGRLWEGQLADMVRAVEAYRECLGFDPQHAPTIEALDRIVHGDNEPMLAAQVLEPLYEQLAEWEKLVDLYEVMVRHTEDPIARIDRLHQIAGIFERQLSEFDKAFGAYARALALDPTHEHTVAQLQRLAELTGEWERFASLLAEQTDKVLDPLQKVEMLLRLATILEQRLGDTTRAVARYQEVLESDAENAAAIAALDRIFTAQERWPDLVVNLRRQIATTGDEAQVIELYFRMGQVQQLAIVDLRAAIDAYREILNINPAHGPTLQALELIFAEGEHQLEIAEIVEPIYYASERWDALVKLGEVKLGFTRDTADRLAIIQNVAEISEHRLGDAGDAYVWWLRAYLDDPLNEQVNLELDRLAEVTLEWGHIVAVGDQVLEQQPAPQVRLAVLMRSAKLLDGKLQDFGRAITMYRAVLEIEPESAEALEALDRIYAQSGMADDLAEILQRRIRATMDAEVLTELEMRLGQTYEYALANVDQAIAAYTRVLDHDPQLQAAMERLEQLYLSQFKWEELFANYQRLVDVANTDEDMAGAYQRMAKIASDALGRESDAIDLWNRVLDLRGEDPVALGELALLHQGAERWAELVEVLERQVFVIDEPAARVAAYQTLGRVYGEKLERERNALDAWLNALELAPHDMTTLEALEGIYERSQAWVELVDILHRLLGVGVEQLGAARARDLYAKAGRIQGEYLMASDEAIGSWHQVLELDGADMEALAALESLYTQAARWGEAIRVLERKSSVLSETDAKIDVLMQVAGIWEEQLGEQMQAAGAYQEILELAPAHLAASEALEQIYRNTEDYGSLAELLINRAEVITDRDHKVAVLQAAAKVLEENLEDQDTAFAILQAAFNEDYTNDVTSRELERLATVAGKWTELLNEYNGLVEQIADPNEQSELWVKIGRWYGEHLQRPDYGLQSLDKALALNPESVSALREMVNFHRRAGAAADLAATLARIVPLEQEPEVQSATLLDLAQVQEQALADLPAAVESYRRVLEIEGDSVVALEALARLHEQMGAWTDLVGVLGRRAAIADDPDLGLELKKRIGRVQESALGDAAAAIETYRDIVAQEPTDVDGLTALERLYLAGNQVSQYLEILEQQLDATADVDQQVAIYEKMAAGLVNLANDRERATEVLEKVVMLDPSRDATYRQLEELYRGLEKWNELVDTYRAHVDAANDPRVKVELLDAMGVVFEKNIQDVDRAIDCYSEILGIDGSNFDAANMLSRLQERIEDWPSAVQTMGRLADLTSDPGARMELLTRMGRVLSERLMDAGEAEMRLNQALELDPGYVPALVLLAAIYKDRADWLKAARTLEAASESSGNQLEKTRLCAEAAFVYWEQLEDRTKAISLFDRVLMLDPEHVQVGRVLGDVYFQAGEFAKASPIYDMLARKVEQLELDDDDQRDLFLRAAQVARAQGDLDKALKQYKRAYDIDSTNHQVLVGMADLHFEQQDWERSFKLYQTILVQHRDSQTDEETVQVYFRLGVIKNRQGEPRKALNYFEKALEVDAHHRPTLHAVIELQSAARDWEGVIQAKRAIIDVTPEADEQFTLFSEVGEIYAEKIGNKDKAASAFEEALAIKPEDYAMLHRLLDLYVAVKRWEDAIRIIDRIVEMEGDAQRRSRYNYTAAVLLRDNLGAHDEAIDRFNTVLDDDPTMLKAFQAIDAMVTKTKDWKSLERSYRKMLKRLPADGQEPLKLTLWNNLGEIYRTRLQDWKSAAAAFDIAARLEPENVDRHIILAELYAQLVEQDPAEYVDKAVGEHQILIASEPFRYDSYHALFSIYEKTRQVDKALCVASTLVFLKKATDKEQAFVEQYQRPEWVKARQRLGEEVLRKNVFHPDEDLYLTGIMGLIAPAVAAWRMKDLSSTLDAKSRVDISIDPSMFSQLAKYVKDVLNVAQPEVYLQPKTPGDLVLANGKRDNVPAPTLVVYQNLLRGKTEKHLAFALGRHMIDLYLPHYAFVALDRSPQSLKQVFMALLLAMGIPVQGDQQGLQAIAREILGRMQPAAQDQLKTLIKRFIDAGGSTDVKRWAAASELTAYRVGLLLCGDIVIAAQMISQEQAMLGSAMTPKDKIKELVLYSISEDYFAARRSIGVAVG